MALFINQKQQRSELQERIAADLRNRVNSSADANNSIKVGEGILEDTEETNNGSLLQIGIITAAVIALVVFVLFWFKGL